MNLSFHYLNVRITHSDLSDYTCVARNGEGRIHHTVRVVIAGTVQYSTVQYSTVQYSTVQYSTVQ